MSELERWEARFSAPGYLFGKEPNGFLKSKAHLLKPGQKALSIADGEGRNGVFLAEQGLDVLAIDISPTALAKSQALAKERGVTLRTELAELATWQWPAAAFEVVVAIFFQFCTPAERAQVFANIKRALKPGGLLLMQGYRRNSLFTRPAGHRRWRISIRGPCWNRRSAISPRSKSTNTTASSTRAPDTAACPR